MFYQICNQLTFDKYIHTLSRQIVVQSGDCTTRQAVTLSFCVTSQINITWLLFGISKAWDRPASHLNMFTMLRKSGTISPFVLFITFLVLPVWFVTRHTTPFITPPPPLMQTYTEETENAQDHLITTSAERHHNVREENMFSEDPDTINKHKSEAFVEGFDNSDGQQNVIAVPDTNRKEEQKPEMKADVIRYKKTMPIKKRNKSTIILAWNSFMGVRDYYVGLGSKPFTNCPVSNCIFTNDHRYLSDSSAILFSATDLESVPAYRDPKQFHVLFLTESPGNVPWVDLEHTYNLTMTYRLDSDIHAPYGQVYKKPVVESTYKLKYPFANRTRSVAWVATQCVTAGKREHYVHELQRYIDVDIYGACGNMTGCGLRGQDTECFRKMIPGTYKFYLAFENSVCEDYVTEKLFRSLVTEIVPVVYGGTNYSRDAPPHSVINVEEYNSPQELALYLKRVAANETEYNAYFEWNKGYGVKHAGAFCKLCEFANKSGFYKTYRNMTSWWFDGKCKPPIDVIK